MTREKPRVWVLLGSRRGDNNQMLALAESLGIPFETRTLTYRSSARIRMKLFPRGIGHLSTRAKDALRPPWPDLVIGIGRRSVPVACWIRERSGGRARLVRLGHPRAPNDRFDLVITTAQYPVPAAKNVLRLPLALHRFRKPPPATDEETAWLERLPRPHLLLSIGGSAPMWRLDIGELGAAFDQLAARARQLGGTLILAASPRTPRETRASMAQAADAAPNASVAPDGLRYAVLLADADEQFVTADSVSMISEAVMSGKPVGLIPVRPDARGRMRLRGDPSLTPIRDIRRFWAELDARGLAGTVSEPRSGPFDDPAAIAAAAVRERSGGLFD